ncbi:hypothetical protein EIP86_000017 [Pleurotus ostreatoroseus]|nr:hypothetical protein EIP86_000017 [Pleurotus ostreatoroseus]
MSSEFHAHAIYRDLMTKLGQGVPLWYPEPEIPNGDTGGEVQIGDVGFYQSGQFMRILNVLPDEVRNSEDTIHGPPEGEDPLIFDQRLKRTRAEALQPGLHGQGVENVTNVNVEGAANAGIVPAGAGAGFQFNVKTTKGAMLVLPKHANLENLLTSMVVPNYIRQHIESWQRHMKSIDIKVQLEDILFVRGTIKTSNWTVAAFKQDSKSQGGSLQGSLTPAAGARFDLKLGHQSACSKDSRTRPLVDSGQDPSCDQCVFLQVYKLKPRLLRFLPSKIEAQAGPHQLPRHNDDDDNAGGSDAQIVSDPDSTFRYAPVDLVLDYILDTHPEVELAVACEEDINDMLGGGPWLEPGHFRQYLEEHRPEVYVDPETNLGMLSLEHAIRGSRMQTIRRNIQAATEDQMDVEDDGHDGDEAGNDRPRGSDPLGDGSIILGRTLPNGEPIKWPHVSLTDSAADGCAVASIALAPDGTHLATGMDDSVIRIWDYKTGAMKRKLSGHDDTPWSLSYSPDGTLLVSGSADNSAILWNMRAADNEQPLLLRLEGHTSDVWSVAYSPDGRRIATASTDSKIFIWDSENGDRIRTFEVQGASVMHVLWTPDSTRIVSCGESGARCWSVENGQQLLDFRGHDGAVWCMSLSQQGDRLITGSEDHTARIWSMTTGDELVTLSEHNGAIWAVAFSDDGEDVAFGGYDNRLIVCNSFDGNVKWAWGGDGDDEEIIVNTIAFSRAGDLVAAGAADGGIRLYDNRKGRFIAQYSAHSDKVKSVQFAKDDLDLISSSDDGSVRVFNILDTLRLGL